MKPVSCDEMVIVNVVRPYRKHYTLGSRKRGVHVHAQPRPAPWHSGWRDTERTWGRGTRLANTGSIRPKPLAPNLV